MKYLILSLTLLALSCGNDDTTDYRWIRSYSSGTITGARFAVEDRRFDENDSLMIVKMERIRSIISNIYDSIPGITKKKILERIQPLVEDAKFSTKNINKYFTLTEKSSDKDFKLQLALLEYELLNDCVKQIGINDPIFDTLELRFVPTMISNTRVRGELLFLASNNNLENEAKMYVNNKQIDLKGRAGIVDIPRNELKDGKFTAKIEFIRADLDLEANIEVLKE